MTPAATVDGDAIVARIPALPGGVALLNAAENSPAPVYLVGGAVRDIALGLVPRELDVVVDGDPQTLVASLDGDKTVFDRFGTARIDLPDGAMIDVARARTETYSAPGALPDVVPASLDDDLVRRDVTVNAIAVDLRSGTVRAAPHARDDLAAGRLRVLHDASFVDDPTRILRGVTYEARYGFRFDDRTEGLARACLASGHVGDLSSSRLRDELVDLLEDARAADGIRRLGELGVDTAIHPSLRGDCEAAELFARAVALRDELGVDVPSWRLGIEAMARRMSSEEGAGWLDRLKVRRRDVEHIVDAVSAAPRIVERLSTQSLNPAQVVTIADPFAPDAPLLALAYEDRPELRDYFTRLRGVRLEIDGSDLIAMGLEESPRIGEILQRVRERKLNGELAGRQAELDAARALVATSAS